MEITYNKSSGWLTAKSREAQTWMGSFTFKDKAKDHIVFAQDNVNPESNDY
jgi:hypothetical protein